MNPGLEVPTHQEPGIFDEDFDLVMLCWKLRVLGVWWASNLSIEVAPAVLSPGCWECG